MADIERLREELKKTLHRMMLEDTRIWLIKTLLRRKLATWDVYNFARKQSDLRTTIKDLDWRTMNCALRTKLKDINWTLNGEKRKKAKLEQDMRILFSTEQETTKKIMAPFRTLIKKEKKERINILKNKIEHLMKKQKQPENAQQIINKKPQTVPPKYLMEYDGLRIFSPSDAFPKKEAPVGPYIGSESIFLSEGEKKLLSRDPKYSLRREVEKIDFETEVEKMNIKKKYGVQYKKEGGDKIDIPQLKEEELDTLNEKEKELSDLWKEESSRVVFDPILNKIDFTNRRPTDYKHNKRVILPKTGSTEVELECHMRKSKYLQVLEKYLQNRRKEETTSHLNAMNMKKKKKDKKMIYNNLSKAENEALISLRKRVSDGEIIITTTDKSGRMAVLTREQFIKAGEVHTLKDEVLDWGKVHYIQNQVNAHTWWFSRILGNSNNTDPTRMNKNIQDVSSQIPEMSLLVKDHKQQKEGAPITTRPVLSGNNCLNTHLSELVSEVVEPISTRLTSAEITSTEEALQKFTQLNDMIREDKFWWKKEKNNILNLIGQEENELTNILEELENAPVCDRDSQNAVTDSAEQADVHVNEFIQTRLADHWVNLHDNDQSVVSGTRGSTEERLKNLDVIASGLREKAGKDKCFGQKVEHSVHASVIWGRKLDLVQQGSQPFSQTQYSPQPTSPSLQNFNEKPVIIGADVSALYPNIKKEVAGELIYRATTQCDLDFNGINFDMLSVYLFLVLGDDEMWAC